MAAKDPRLKKIGVEGYKVYLHLRADTEEVFYVGKGNRWRENATKNRNKHWHRMVNKYGKIVKVVAKGLTNQEACLLEKKLIKEIGRHNLVNYTDGGEGSSGYCHTKAALIKMRGRDFSSEHIENLSKAKLNNPVRFWSGKNRPVETKEKISAALSNPNRRKAESLLLNGIKRKEIAQETGLTLQYLRSLALQMRRKGCDIEKQIN